MQTTKRTFNLISFDILNTLLKTSRSPYESYSQYAKSFGIRDVDRCIFESRYKKRFQEMSVERPFYGLNKCSAVQWWREIVIACYSKEVTNDEYVLHSLANHIYYEYEKSDQWSLLPHALNLLTVAKQSNVPMIVVSNFDERIENILENVGIRSFFHDVFIPKNVGVGKPNSEMFRRVLTKLKVFEAKDVLHIGDDYHNDYLAPCAVGMNAILTNCQSSKEDLTLYELARTII
ncbi:hypothetical protein GJ496_002254 [Pomphorhynchus laevis]|nr:hypothetical protein GJ496_002254 [Pomphorhynchus laevis]